MLKNILFARYLYLNIIFILSLLALILIGIVFYSQVKSSFALNMEMVGASISIGLILVCFILFNAQLKARVNAEKALVQLAYYHPLTKLPNRIHLINRLNEQIEKGKYDSYYISILFLNLNGFKNINDSFGFETGNEVLKLTAARLKEFAADKYFVAHIGGDEFVVILPGIFDCVPIVEEIHSLIKEKIQIHQQTVRVNVSIGISIFPSNGLNAEELLKNANIAMYVAKEKRSPYQICNLQMTMSVEQRALLVYLLQQAMSRNELMVFYQPKVSLKKDQVIGVEALMRWRRPDGSFVDPNYFISLAEDNFLIMELGDWMLFTVCEQIKKWRKDGFLIENVAINISPLQLEREDFVDTVKEAIRQTHIDPAILEFEITESIFLKDIQENIEKLTQLKKLGIQITIDDFGTGFATFGYIRSFSIDKIKIDQSFIKLMIYSDRDSVIIRSIINMAHGLGFKVVAEGVETEVQVAFLKDHNCDEAQGFYYSKAVPAGEIVQFF